MPLGRFKGRKTDFIAQYTVSRRDEEVSFAHDSLPLQAELASTIKNFNKEYVKHYAASNLQPTNLLNAAVVPLYYHSPEDEGEQVENLQFMTNPVIMPTKTQKIFWQQRVLNDLGAEQEGFKDFIACNYRALNLACSDVPSVLLNDSYARARTQGDFCQHFHHTEQSLAFVLQSSTAIEGYLDRLPSSSMLMGLEIDACSIRNVCERCMGTLIGMQNNADFRHKLETAMRERHIDYATDFPIGVSVSFVGGSYRGASKPQRLYKSLLSDDLQVPRSACVYTATSLMQGYIPHDAEVRNEYMYACFPGSMFSSRKISSDTIDRKYSLVV